ncbi:hypothetical protein A3L12_02565 [Thermococcus sp. P6]|uniref:hypothetical protein n=1 Tax=Thermococcus sp. P6 TaxID=122420 RepID=UPI000B59B733|nr:hypothetical protein [Thermococcus sp. P6]ASJ10253.1 hypothetical protein A3L12_02565 [Thermococcus sp. P6]
MRKFAVTLMLLLLVAILPGSSAEFLTFTTKEKISVLSGDYSDGRVPLTNAGGFSFKVVSYQTFWVEDETGTAVPGFNLTVRPTVFTDWSSGKTYLLSYNLSCESNVSEGNYTLYLRFLAYTTTGSLYLVYAAVPLHVIGKALDFGVADAYVMERPGSSYALNGETVVVFSHVTNVGHSTVSLEATVSLSADGKVYFLERKTLNMSPGDNLIRFKVPVSYDLPEGTYRLDYVLKYGDETYRYSKELPVKFGVKLVGVSLQADRVKLGEENKVYLTLLSERDIGLNLTVETYSYNGSPVLVGKTTKTIALRSGTNVLEVSLPTNTSGSLKSLMELTFDGRTVGKANVSYTVFAPPVIKNVTSERVSGNGTLFRVVINNPDQKTEGRLSYRISVDGNILYKGYLKVTLKPGRNEVSVMFELPVNRTVEYEFELSALGEVSVFRGELYLKPPIPTTSSTTASPPETTPSSTTPSSTIVTPSESSSGYWPALIVILVLLVAVALYYAKGNEEPKKRTRPKPKRRSPLGRFKRPKKPKFLEKKELPKG